MGSDRQRNALQVIWNQLRPQQILVKPHAPVWRVILFKTSQFRALQDGLILLELAVMLKDNLRLVQDD